MKYYNIETKEILESLNTTENGLNADEAKNRLLKNGPNKLKETKYTIDGKRVCLKEILKDYRNKTFHNQKRTYYNHNKLYSLDLMCCDLEINKMIEILKYNIKHNIMIEIQSNINILNSEFMKKGYVTYLKNILNRLKRGNKNE